MRLSTAVIDTFESGQPRFCPANTYASGGRLEFAAVARSSSTAELDSGTRCSTCIFIRSFGMVHNALSKSNSDHVALRVSLVLVAHRMVSSSALAADPDCWRSRSKKTGERKGKRLNSRH